LLLDTMNFSNARFQRDNWDVYLSNIARPSVGCKATGRSSLCIFKSACAW
jgi:hypothetical protein